MRIKKFNRSLHRRRTKIALVAGVVVLVAIVTAAVGISVLIARHNHKSPQSELPLEAPSPDNPTVITSDPGGVAADSAGDVYVADSHNGRVLKLAAGATTQSVLPFSDLKVPQWCGGGHRGQRLRDRLSQPAGAETGGAVMHRKATAPSGNSTRHDG